MLTLVFIFVLILLIGIPVGLSYLIFKFIKRKGFDKRLSIVALTPILFVTYQVYTAIYPGEDFYRNDFQEVSGIELPQAVEFEFKTTSFPDHFGDYTSVSVIRVGKDFYQLLPDILNKKGLKEENTKIDSRRLSTALENLDDLKIEKEYFMEEGAGVYYYVGFLSDDETIIVNRLSW